MTKRPDARDLPPAQRLQVEEAEYHRAVTFLVNTAGLILSTGLLVGVGWIVTHVEVVFG